MLACGCKVLIQPSPELEALPWDPGSRLGFYSSPEGLLDLMRREQATPADKDASKEILSVARSVVGHRDMVEQIDRAMEPV